VEEPWVKAGKHWYAMHARGKIFPRTKGVAMTPTDHPYGGKSKRPRPSKTVARTAPPGAKVGSIAARRVGKKKL
jgi:large subunit ribosomal protein L2